MTMRRKIFGILSLLVLILATISILTAFSLQESSQQPQQLIPKQVLEGNGSPDVAAVIAGIKAYRETGSHDDWLDYLDQLIPQQVLEEYGSPNVAALIAGIKAYRETGSHDNWPDYLDPFYRQLYDAAPEIFNFKEPEPPKRRGVLAAIARLSDAINPKDVIGVIVDENSMATILKIRYFESTYVAENYFKDNTDGKWFIATRAKKTKNSKDLFFDDFDRQLNEKNSVYTKDYNAYTLYDFRIFEFRDSFGNQAATSSAKAKEFLKDFKIIRTYAPSK